MNTLLLLMSCVPGENVSSKVAEALGIAVAPMPIESTIYDDYDKAYAESLRTRKPLVVWVGQRPRSYGGTVACYQPTFSDYPAKCVVVSKPGDGTIYWVATLDGAPMAAQIDDALKRMPEPTTGSLPVVPTVPMVHSTRLSARLSSSC
jgi:hypothetical protein